MFDKAEYWKRRAEGKRGQGEYEPPEAPLVGKQVVKEGQHAAFRPGIGYVTLNRQQSRRKVVDRTMTRKGYAYGKKLG